MDGGPYPSVGRWQQKDVSEFYLSMEEGLANFQLLVSPGGIGIPLTSV